ncbi:cache domain-containing protein [Paenibacillus rhizoplanae]
MVVSVSTPLLDDSGKLIGVASADISIEQITAALGAFNYKGSGYAVLVDETGTFIYHPNPDHILLKKMADLGGAWKAVGDKMLQWGSNVIRTDIDGEPSYVSYSPAVANQWSVALIVPQKHAELELKRFELIFLPLHYCFNRGAVCPAVSGLGQYSEADSAPHGCVRAGEGRRPVGKG